MKKNKILIISSIIILVLGCATFATLYFATDIFKSDKEKFYKYLSEVNFNEFIDKEFYKEYSEKMKNTKFEENSELSINIGTLQKEINIETKKDIPNKLAKTDVSVDSNEALLSFARDNDTFGVKFNEILNGYITIENNNLQELAEKIETDNMIATAITSAIPDKIEISENEEILNIEEIKPIIKKYKNTILNQISDEEYSKVKGQETTFGDETVKSDGYKLTLTSEELVNIIKTLLEEMKNDKEVFDLLARTTEDLTELTFEDYQSSFESLISDFDSEFDIGTETKISIIAYKDIKKVEFIVESEETIITVGIESTENPKITINLNADTNVEIVINKTLNKAEQEKWETELNIKR